MVVIVVALRETFKVPAPHPQVRDKKKPQFTSLETNGSIYRSSFVSLLAAGRAGGRE